jgi:hypothetical protein
VELPKHLEDELSRVADELGRLSLDLGALSENLARLRNTLDAPSTEPELRHASASE